MSQCTAAGCAAVHYATGLCKLHYDRQWITRNAEANRAKVKRWQQENAAKMAAKGKRYRMKHADKERQRGRKYRETHPVENRERHRAYQQANRDRAAAKQAKRRALALNATPAWANDFFIAEIYDLARLRSKITGIPWHVDHIVPLRSSVVCGLHVESNLRVIPGAENRSKSNRHWPDMPRAR